jgi:superfamily I DNA/RNA helicase
MRPHSRLSRDANQPSKNSKRLHDKAETGTTAGHARNAGSDEASYPKAQTNTRAESRIPMRNQVKSILILAFNKAIAEEMNIRIRTGRVLPTPTDYVMAICNEVMYRAGNIVVNALAGSGKSTTLETIAAKFPGADVRASTIHSFCMRSFQWFVKGKHGVTNVEVQGDKIPCIIRQITNYDTLNADDKQKIDLMLSPVHRLVDLARTYTFTSLLPEPQDSDLQIICAKHDVELPDSVDNGISESDVFDLVRRTLVASNKNITTIDFVDMIHLCLVLNVTYWQHDLIMVDESQDLDPMQIAVIKRASHDLKTGFEGQVVFVGDRNQAIYGFRGADVEAIENVVKEFKAKELPLSTCWRCPTAVIEEAQKIVPAIEAAPNAIEGKVDTLGSHDDMLKMAEAGDFVLCRTTAPLVETCMQFIRAGKAATVRGRDIGQGLVMLADKIKRRRTSKGKDLLDALYAYREDSLAKLSHPSKEAQRQSLSDKIDTLLVLAEECETFDQVKVKIQSIFSDVQNGELKNLILCSTAHKAKGLESERVFIVHPELMPLPFARQDWQKKQEMNLKYVAITRATRELYWVFDSKKKASDGKTPYFMTKEECEKSAELNKEIEVKPKKTRKPRAVKAKIVK